MIIFFAFSVYLSLYNISEDSSFFLNRLGQSFARAACRGFYFDYLYSHASLLLLRLALLFHTGIESGFLKLLGPQGLFSTSALVFRFNRSFQTKRINDYFLSIYFSVGLSCVVIGYIILFF